MLIVVWTPSLEPRLERLNLRRLIEIEIEIENNNLQMEGGTVNSIWEAFEKDCPGCLFGTDMCPLRHQNQHLHSTLGVLQPTAE